MLPEVVTTAFQRAGVPAPDAGRVDRAGYSAAEQRIIAVEVKRRRAAEDAAGGVE